MGEIIQLPVRINRKPKNESYLFQEEPPEEFLKRLWDLLSSRPEIHSPLGNATTRTSGSDSV